MSNKERVQITNLNIQRTAAGNVLALLKTTIIALITMASVAMMIFTIVSVFTFDRNDRSLFGYQAFIVRSDSMSATDFASGDLIFTKQVNPSSLHAGDIISFRSNNTSNFGEIVTHKIRSLTTDSLGAPGFITFGTTTDTDDESIVTYEYVIGKYIGHLPGVGTFFSFLKTTPGYFSCIFLPFMVLILLQGWNTLRLFRKYRAEQQAKIQAEREQIAAEREEARCMMEKLQKMRSAMGMAPLEALPDPGKDGTNAALHTMDKQQEIYLTEKKSDDIRDNQL